MHYHEIKARLHKAGVIQTIHLKSLLSPLKSAESDIAYVEKYSILYVRNGIEYANIQAVKAAHGVDWKPAPLPWGKWFEYPLGIEHKGQIYVRLYLPSEEQVKQFNLKPSVVFTAVYENGPMRQISRQEAVEICGSKAESGTRPDCMTVCTETIVKIVD